MLYGELGRYPLAVNVKLRKISYRCRLISKEDKLRSSLYKRMYNLQMNGLYNYKWISCVQNIFDKTGLSSQCIICFSSIKPLLKTIVWPIYTEMVFWYLLVILELSGEKEFKLEEYLMLVLIFTAMLSFLYRKCLCKQIYIMQVVTNYSWVTKKMTQSVDYLLIFPSCRLAW